MEFTDGFQILLYICVYISIPCEGVVRLFFCLARISLLPDYRETVVAYGQGLKKPDKSVADTYVALSGNGTDVAGALPGFDSRNVTFDSSMGRASI